jgi:hypothetical protein
MILKRVRVSKFVDNWKWILEKSFFNLYDRAEYVDTLIEIIL